MKETIFLRNIPKNEQFLHFNPIRIVTIFRFTMFDKTRTKCIPKQVVEHGNIIRNMKKIDSLPHIVSSDKLRIQI